MKDIQARIHRMERRGEENASLPETSVRHRAGKTLGKKGIRTTVQRRNVFSCVISVRLVITLGSNVIYYHFSVSYGST